VALGLALLLALALAPGAHADHRPDHFVDYACPTVIASVSGGRLPGSEEIGRETTITARLVAGPPDTRLALARLSPAPVAVVRQASDTATSVTWTLRLGENHRFLVRGETSQHCISGGGGGIVDTYVRPELSITARRNGPRDYTFRGRVLPGRGQTVSLVRLDGTAPVLTARTTVRPDGTYSVRRTFTGSGRFGFLVTVAASSTNRAGSSTARPTVIH
jgi:hypothetical protein